MDKMSRENYELEDFISDESFINCHFKSDKADQLFWEEWMINHPAKKALAEEAKEIIETLALTISEKEYQEEFKKITGAISKKKQQHLGIQLMDSHKLLHLYQRRKRVIRYILPLVLILIAGGYWLFKFSQNRASKLTETVNNSGMPLILTLSDSTIVTLDPNSYLQYPLHFKDKERVVYLYGNAQFSVKRNVEYPFKVHAENIVATVLGTIFNIKSLGDSAIVVELLKGKLNVEIMNAAMETEQSVLLDPNERAVYVRSDKHLYKNFIVTEHHFHFSGSNFDEIALRVKEEYGITLINESPKKNWSFTGDFKDSTAKDIVENICLVKKLSFVIKDDTIVIK